MRFEDLQLFDRVHDAIRDAGYTAGEVTMPDGEVSP